MEEREQTEVKEQMEEQAGAMSRTSSGTWGASSPSRPSPDLPGWRPFPGACPSPRARWRACTPPPLPSQSRPRPPAARRGRPGSAPPRRPPRPHVCRRTRHSHTWSFTKVTEVTRAPQRGGLHVHAGLRARWSTCTCSITTRFHSMTLISRMIQVPEKPAAPASENHPDLPWN